MTKILYNRAAKTFMDAISAGFDEDGAYEKVKKKHGKVLADAVYAEALAEMQHMDKKFVSEMKAMKKNPRVPKRSLVGRYVNHWKKGRGKIIDERVDYVVVKFEDGSQDRFEKSRIKGK